jgi:hypothetical protein
MRAIGIVLAAALVVCLFDVQAFAAGNTDRTYYWGAGSCGGAAYCSYRAKMRVKAPKPHSSAFITFHGVLSV